MKKFIFLFPLFISTLLVGEINFERVNINKIFEKQKLINTKTSIIATDVNNKGVVVGYYDDASKNPTKRILFVASEESSILFPQFDNEPNFVQFSDIPHIDDNGDIIGLWLKKMSTENW